MSIKKKRVLRITGVLIAILLVFVIWFSQNWYKIPGMLKAWEEHVLENQEIVWKKGPAARISNKPNVIVILVDDLGFNEISTYGGGMANGQLKTPHIDQMAAEGALCTNGYCAHAVCAPSRASLLTGRYATRAGFEFTPTAPSMMKFIYRISNEKLHPPRYHSELEGMGPKVEDMGLPLSEITIAELLKPQGYHNIHIGKWHLGNSMKFNPTNQGFDESLGLHSGSLFLPIDDPNVVNAYLPFDPIDKFLWGNLAHAANWNGGHRFHPDGHTTDYLTNEALKAIKANKNNPFFMYLAYWAVHTPLQASKEDYDQLSFIEDHAERVQAAMVMTVDRGVGKIRQALRDHGLDENTIIVFTSDNGAPGYIGMPDVNHPYRGWKITLFEGGIHIPYIVSWPGTIPAGRTFEGRVSNLDIFSTFAAIAGADLPTDRKLDGVNILPYLIDSTAILPDRPLFYKGGNYSSVIQGDWKLQVDDVQEKMWLFDLANDPTEQKNLIYDAPNKLRELRLLLESHLQEQSKSLWPALLESPVYIDKTLDQKKTEKDEFIYWAN